MKTSNTLSGEALIIGKGSSELPVVQLMVQLSRGKLFKTGNNGSSFLPQRCWIIQQIMVLPSARRRGHASAVIHEIESFAAKEEYGVFIQSVLSNEMHALALKLGYAPTMCGGYLKSSKHLL